jgi:hypothetical protein
MGILRPMKDWLRRLAGRSTRTQPDQQLQQLREDLRRGAAEFPLEDLRPVLIPSPILATGRWVGPFHHFPELPVSLTWAYLRPSQTMIYLSHELVAMLDSRGIDWRSTARDALVREFGSRPWTRELRDSSGALEGIALMHEDGLGPSRLICSRRLLRQFPDGFEFFVPERSCAFLVGSSASAETRSRIEHVVRQCFEHAEVPMSTSGFGHEALLSALDGAGEVLV